MSDYLEGKAVLKVTEGLRVDRAAAAVPLGATTGNLFRIVGGRVIVRQIIGLVTVELGAGANLSSLNYDPDDGAADDLSDTVDLVAAAAGTVIVPTGDPTDNLEISVNVINEQAIGFVLKPGVITLTCADGPADGRVSWSVLYVPIDDGAYIEVA